MISDKLAEEDMSWDQSFSLIRDICEKAKEMEFTYNDSQQLYNLSGIW